MDLVGVIAVLLSMTALGVLPGEAACSALRAGRYCGGRPGPPPTWIGTR
jgi:hypothetical protein